MSRIGKLPITVPSGVDVTPVSSHQRGSTKATYRAAAMHENDACHNTATQRRILLLEL